MRDPATKRPSGDEPTQDDLADVKPKKKRKKGSQRKDTLSTNENGESSTKASKTHVSEGSTSSDSLNDFIRQHTITFDPPSAVQSFPPLLEMSQLSISGDLRSGLKSFSKPTPIQSLSWPILVERQDLVGIAQTGSGKTLAFGIPLLHCLQGQKRQGGAKIEALTLAPTRELALQTHETLNQFGQCLNPPMSSVCIYGGVDKNSQRKALRSESSRLVVGTPGRILDLSNEGSLDLSNVSFLVLDEADRLLDKGFENDIRQIINKCKTTSRITAMFSATWPTGVRGIAKDFMSDPIRVSVGSEELVASALIEQSVLVLEDGRQKESRLRQVLQDHGVIRKSNRTASATACDKAIVFALYKKEAQRLFITLKNQGLNARCIQGDMSQLDRQASLEDFRTGDATVLVATDVAARGLDIPKVDLVVNVTFPLTIEDYIHRIGRTGRAGRPGKSVTLFTEHDKLHAGELIRVLRDAKQTVPEDLSQWGTTIKKKSHAAYGDFYRDVDSTKKGKKITFD